MTTATRQLSDEEIVVCWQGGQSPTDAARLLSRVTHQKVTVSDVLLLEKEFREAGVLLKSVDDQNTYISASYWEAVDLFEAELTLGEVGRLNGMIEIQ